MSIFGSGGLGGYSRATTGKIKKNLQYIYIGSLIKKYQEI